MILLIPLLDEASITIIPIFFVLIVSLIVLVKSSEYFIESSVSIARMLNISDFIIGLTIVAVGTSMPELASSLAAALINADSIATGTLFGSNITNIGLILGITAVFQLIKTKKIMFQRDSYILIFISLLVLILGLDLTYSFIDGLVLLIIFVLYILYLTESMEDSEQNFSGFIGYVVNMKFFSTLKLHFERKAVNGKDFELKKFLKHSATLIVSLIVIFISAKFLIDSAILLAGEFHLTQGFIGVTLIAVGTSLPEMAVSLMSVKKGYTDIMIGNIIGSNIANITLILGLTAIVSPLALTMFDLNMLIPFMILISALLMFFIGSRAEIRQAEGILLLVLYTAFIYFMFINSLVV